MAYPAANGTFLPAPLPEHGLLHPDPDVFLNELLQALLAEARSYISDAKTVGILLSGGMDSRIVSGVVKALQDQERGKFSVVGLTWGHTNSRDVVYAQQIVKRFGWDWEHFPITPETLARNIRYMGEMGAEVSPLHLHAMPDVADTPGIDVVLAGSYGDSVGRAEFSGKKVTELSSILPKRLNPFGIIKARVLKGSLEYIKSDVEDSPHVDSTTLGVRRYEIEQEMHYMRRMLQSCMLSIAQKKRFYQMFTSPDVFGRMWSLDPAIRNDSWYCGLLKLLPGNLMDIPWARTGCRFDQPGSQLPDKHSKNYHSYGVWLRNELKNEVLDRVNSSRVRSLGVFNDKAFECMLDIWSEARTTTTNRLDEIVSWLATLHDFMEIYDLYIDEYPKSLSMRDRLNSIYGRVYSKAYIALRNRFRD